MRMLQCRYFERVAEAGNLWSAGIASRTFATLMLASIVGMTQIQPVFAESGKHPVWKFFTSLIIRTTVGTPKTAGADEIAMQHLLNQSDKYQLVVERARAVGLNIVPGGMRQVKIPIVRYLFFFVPISIGSRPHVFVLQPMTDASASQLSALIVDKKLDEVLGVAVLDPEGFAGKSVKDSPVYKRTFIECTKEHFAHCGEPCARRLFTCAPVSLGLSLAGQFVPAVSSYVVCVLGNEECGGCACEALTDTIIDYGFSKVPAPPSKSEDNSDTKVGAPGNSK